MSDSLRLWGRANSINVRKVMLCLQWLGLPYERIDAGMSFGKVDTPEYRNLNPNGKVPVFQHGSYTLWESNVIVRYLCASYSNDHLYPRELKTRFEAERWMDWQQTTLNPASGPPFKQWIRTPAAQRSEAVIAQSVQACMPHWRLLEHTLSLRPYIAGEAMSMADFVIAVEVHRWFHLPQPESEIAQFPAIARWYAPLFAAAESAGVLDQTLS